MFIAILTKTMASRIKIKPDVCMVSDIHNNGIKIKPDVRVVSDIHNNGKKHVVTMQLIEQCRLLACLIKHVQLYQIQFYQNQSESKHIKFFLNFYVSF